MNYINFNNSGSSKTFTKTLERIKFYLDKEQTFGGYLCSTLFDKKIKNFYFYLSKLLSCKQEELSFIQSTTNGFNFIINSLTPKKSSNVIIFDNEYESNIICLLKNKINFQIVKTTRAGDIDFQDLKKKIDNNTILVSLCHISSQCGNYSPVVKVGKFIKTINPKIFYLVDACQSVGQKEVNVRKIQCDALIGSGRKYLRGPRGTGFIFLKTQTNFAITPSIVDSYNTRCLKKFKFIRSHIFENFEYSRALKLGLAESINQINLITVKKIEKNIKKKSYYLREKLKNNSGITFYENIEKLTGLNTLNIKNLNPKKIYDYLLKKKILTSVIPNRFPLNSNKKLGALRISIHYYNTYKEIDFLVDCLLKISR